jgi:hypothetical protein
LEETQNMLQLHGIRQEKNIEVKENNFCYKSESSPIFFYVYNILNTYSRDRNPLKSSDFLHQEFKMGQSSDRNSQFMNQMWGTNSLVTDYIPSDQKKMLREISNDVLVPKKHDFAIQNEIHEKIRNDRDYDDWEYGTEPLYEVNK